MLCWRSHTYQHSEFLLGPLQLVYLHYLIWPIWPPSANTALQPHPRLQISFHFFAHFVSPPSAPSPPPYAPGCLSTPSTSSLTPEVLQWNVGGLRARCTELPHFISSHLVDLISTQESKLNSSSSFRIPGFCTLRSNCTHSRSGIFSTDASSFSPGKAYLSMNFLPPLFLCVTPTLIM